MNLTLPSDEITYPLRTQGDFASIENGAAMVSVTKRFIVIGGHKTSISLEDEFWGALRELARSRKILLSSFILQIKEAHPKNNLSSAVRVFLLEHYRAQPKPSTAYPVPAANAVLKQRSHRARDVGQSLPHE